MQAFAAERDIRVRNLRVFGLLTILFIATRILLFNGFNGSDDLHYAMLAARLLHNRFDPFQPADIFSGRVLLIGWQAIIYKAGGINLLTTGAGIMAAVPAACFLTIRHLIPRPGHAAVALTCSLFYFFPALPEWVNGISPDPYILLMTVIVLIRLKKMVLSDHPSPQVPAAIGIGCMTALSLLIKETALLLLPLSMALLILYNRKKGLKESAFILFGFASVILLYALVYAHYTGDALFRFVQIRKSAYPNPCNFTGQPFSALAARLTYGIWQAFAVLGFYPFVLGGFILLLSLRKEQGTNPRSGFEPVALLCLFVLGIYFPFSLGGYQPLCAFPRQFLFLLPPAAGVIVPFLTGRQEKSRKILPAIFSAGLLLVVFNSTSNKWQWMIWGLLCLYFCLHALRNQRTGSKRAYLFCAILYLSVLEPAFFRRNYWFQNMAFLNHRLIATTYYFPDHDNMMHWKLLHRFNDATLYCYNLEPDPYTAYKVYYQRPDTSRFSPGWFLVNRAYTTCPQQVLQRIDSLHTHHFFSQQIKTRCIDAFWIGDKRQLTFVESVVRQGRN